MMRDVTARRRGWAFFTGLNTARREWYPVLEPDQVRPLELPLADARADRFVDAAPEQVAPAS